MIAFFRYFSRATAVAPIVLALASPASAQAPYPNRNITLVLPFAAGSGTDTTTRIISKELGTALGTGMVIENKAGANGSIAASYVEKLLGGVCSWMASYFDLDDGTLRCLPADPKHVADIAGMHVNAVAPPAARNRAALR